MKKEFSSWLLLGLFLIIMCFLFIFAFKDKIFDTIFNDSSNQSKQSVNTLEKVMGTKLLKCSKNTIEDDEENSEVITITYRGEQLKVYESEQITNSNNNIELSFSLMKSISDAFSSLDGITMNTIKLSDTSYKVYSKIVYDELNNEQLSKLASDEDTIDIANSDIFKNTTIGFNEYQFKLEKDGYTCEQIGVLDGNFRFFH